MFLLNNMTEMYEGLLNGEQTDVSSAKDLPDVTPTQKESEREENQSMGESCQNSTVRQCVTSICCF